MKLLDHKRINQCDCNTTLELVEVVELILGDNDEMLQIMNKWSCPKCDNIIEEMTMTNMDDDNAPIGYDTSSYKNVSS